jgi:hypothetical protein
MPPSPEVMPHGPLGDLLTNLLALRFAPRSATHNATSAQNDIGAAKAAPMERFCPSTRGSGRSRDRSFKHQRERPQPRSLKLNFAW